MTRNSTRSEGNHKRGHSTFPNKYNVPFSLLGEFIPSAQGLEKDMQEIAAVLECTQMDFLNTEWREVLESEGGRSQLQQQLTKMRRLVEQL